MQEASSDEAILDIQQRLSRPSWFTLYAVVALVVAGATTPFGPAIQVGIAVFLCLLGIPIYRWDSERRTARLIYDIDEGTLIERFALASAAGESLSKSSRLWHVWWKQATSDWKKNAGASHLIQRTEVRARKGSLPHIESNIEPWSIPVGPQQLLFMPDRLLIRQGRSFSFVAYEDLSIVAGTTDFIEDERVPPDSTVIRTTWQYVNKSGGPDRRFKNNRQLNVARYGQLKFENATGLRVVLHSSSVEVAQRVEYALMELQKLATPSRAEHNIVVQNAAPAVAPPAPSTSAVNDLIEVRSSDGPVDAREHAFAFATILKFIGTADRRFTEEERRGIIDAVVGHLGGEASVLNAVSLMVDGIKPDAAAVDGAVDQLNGLDAVTKEQMIASAWTIAKADGKITPKERERLIELCAKMNVAPPNV